jgi:hypothetical protein
VVDPSRRLGAAIRTGRAPRVTKSSRLGNGPGNRRTVDALEPSGRGFRSCGSTRSRAKPRPPSLAESDKVHRVLLGPPQFALFYCSLFYFHPLFTGADNGRFVVPLFYFFCALYLGLRAGRKKIFFSGNYKCSNRILFNRTPN